VLCVPYAAIRSKKQEKKKKKNAPWALTTRGSLSCFYQLSPTGGGEAGVPNIICSFTPLPLFAKVQYLALR
jgi:hypothetical protein